MNGSELCTGAALDGVPQEVNDKEISPRPHPNSVMILPWRPDVAWFASNLCCEGKPFAASNPTIFRNVLDEAASMGFRFNFGIEPKFFLLKEGEDGTPTPIRPRDGRAKPAYDVRSTLDSFDVLEEVVLRTQCTRLRRVFVPSRRR